jgi:hypothetical protein
MAVQVLTTMPCADLKIADGDGKRDLNWHVVRLVVVANNNS